VLDDYGHHPTEIKITLDAIQKSWPGRRLIVMFQAHRYSRTKALYDEFTRSFYQSDLLILLPVYAAGEEQIEGIDNVMLCEGIKSHGHKDVKCFNEMAAAVNYLAGVAKQGDIVLTLGAGDVWKCGESLIKKLDDGKVE